MNLVYPFWLKLLRKILCYKHWGDEILVIWKQTSDNNSTFRIRDSMNKVHVGKNKSLISFVKSKNYLNQL